MVVWGAEQGLSPLSQHTAVPIEVDSTESDSRVPSTELPEHGIHEDFAIYGLAPRDLSFWNQEPYFLNMSWLTKSK